MNEIVAKCGGVRSAKRLKARAVETGEAALRADPKITVPRLGYCEDDVGLREALFLAERFEEERLLSACGEGRDFSCHRRGSERRENESQHDGERAES